MEKVNLNNIKANQLVYCNVVNATKDNRIGIRDTIAVKYFNNQAMGYDLISKRFIQFYSEAVSGECLDILKTIYPNNTTTINIEEIDPLLERYREQPKDLYDGVPADLDKEIGAQTRKRKTLSFTF